MKISVTASLALFLLISVGCGGGSSPVQTSGPLSGNWQVNLIQNYPSPQALLSASGFLNQSSNSLTGSVQGPTIVAANGNTTCGGVGPITGTISGQNVSFSLSPGGTVFNFTGTISSDSTSMSGSYQAETGACFAYPSTGNWTASLIPAMNGNFTGTITNSTYMQTLNPDSASTINVTGSFMQTPNVGANSASLAGTITAQNYPCFSSASVTGTISGNNVVLSVFSYNGDLIGAIGSATPGAQNAATLTTNAGIITLTTGAGGITLGTTNSGPCPVIQSNGSSISSDSATLSFTLQ